MARIRKKTPQKPIKIDKFLGLNQNPDGEIGIRLGESPKMLNYKITPNFNRKKRAGQIDLFASIGSAIQGMWYGKINDSYHFLFACNGNVYEYNFTNSTYASIGTIGDTLTTFFVANEKVYVLADDLYSWDGTTFETVEGYVPTITISTPPTGGGTLYEQKNLLTDKVKQSFSGDGAIQTFQLAETNLVAVDDTIEADGNTYNTTTDYTVDLVNGTVTFTTYTPVALPDNVVIGYTMQPTTDRVQITSCKYAMYYGGSNDTRIHLWGNPTLRNRRIYSDLVNGVPSAEYFPVNAFTNIGSDEFDITDIVLQYDRQIIFTNGGKTYYSYYDFSTLGVSFPTYPLNDAIGNVPFNQVRVIENGPLSLQQGVYQWVSTNVRDERNAQHISKRVQSSLNEVDLSQAVTFDYEEESEYWLCVGSTVWVWNYRNDTWYMHDNINANNFITINGDLYYSTDEGKIVKFDETLKGDNGEPINCYWEMGFSDFGYETITKFMSDAWYSITPQAKTSITYTWKTDKEVSENNTRIYYNLINFNAVDFAHFSFNTMKSPQPIHKKLKAKKWIYFKLIETNNTNDEAVTVLSINLKARLGSERK